MASVTDARVVGNVVTARCMTDREAASEGGIKQRGLVWFGLERASVHFMTTATIGTGVDFTRRRARKTKYQANPLGISSL